MASIQDAVAYLLQHYPHRDELSNARVTKMVYLSDWHQAIQHGRQVTPINWYFDNYGPFVWDVKKAVEANPSLFSVEETRNYFGTPKILLSLRQSGYAPQVTPDEQASLDHVIEATKRLSWDAFIKLVYSTHPVASSQRYSQLDLVAKAHQYKAGATG